MLNDKIHKLRDKLNKSLVDGSSYEEIYRLSVELDILIAEYYGYDSSQSISVGINSNMVI